MRLRDEERLSADALQRHLRDEHGMASSWEGVDPDPPDLRFDVVRCDRWTETWAVEVTGLGQYIEWDGKEVDSRVFGPAISKIIKTINDELGPHMKSGYSLNVTGPLHDGIFRDFDRRVRQYIKDGKTEEEALDGPRTPCICPQ